MKILVEKSRWMALIAVVALLAASLFGFCAALYKSYEAILTTIRTPQDEGLVYLNLIQVADASLVAIGLMIFALSLYELFIGGLNLPKWMIAESLTYLEARLGNIIILVMSVKILEKLAVGRDALETLYFAIAVALVSSVLIAFNVFCVKTLPSHTSANQDDVKNS